MIENHRDEEVCRQWDALADEDPTHHLTVQEYFHYKNKWWLHSNKKGSNTMPLRHRSDFKQALSTLQRSQQEAGEEPHVPTYSYKHKQWELAQSSSSTWWNWQGSWWSSYKSGSQDVKGMYPAPHIHEHFTIHKWLRQTAYILTHNLNMLEHIANNGMNTTMHTDANIAQF